MKHTNIWSWNLGGRCYSCTDTTTTDSGYIKITGVVHTPHGSVEVFSCATSEPWSRLRMSHAGRVYHHTVTGYAYTKRGLCTKARQFAQEVAEGEKP